MTRSSITLQLLSAAALCVAAPAFAQDAAPQAPAPAAAAPAPAAEAPAPAAEAPAPPPPVLPTTGDGAVITTLLTKVCVPIANGGDFASLAKAAGMKQDAKVQTDWVLPLTQKPFQITISDPGTTNKGTCDMQVRYAPGWDQPIIDSLNIWRFLSTPQLHGQRSDKMNSATVQRVTTTWDNYENQLIDGKMIGLILVQLNKPDGTAAINAGYDDAIVQYQIRKAQAGEGVAEATPAPAPTAATPAATPAG